MFDYNFANLNDREFEELTCDLLSRSLNQTVDRFKPGRDSGVDGRFYSTNGDEIIIQCKHYSSSSFSQLISSLKSKNSGKSEIEKVQLLNPDRYIFVTSQALTRSNISTIKDLFSPYIKSEQDIYYKESLNDLIKQSPDIENRHDKLWLCNTQVMQRILYNGIKGRSEDKLNEILLNCSKYVVTETHMKALEYLDKNHCVIIVGEPGIGKTTLAENLCVDFARNDYEMCYIENSLNEAEDIYDPSRKQVFYFDDFLGSNYLEALQPHQDSHICNFINRISRDPKKRFILTSRTNIFNQGKNLSDKFEVSNLNKNELILCVDDLTSLEKAKILYNHTWFNGLDSEYFEEIVYDQRYYEIIHHTSFNPRIIDFITNEERFRDITPSRYWTYVKESLDQPHLIWSNVFNVQSDEHVRTLVSLTVMNRGEISEELLQQSYNLILQFSPINDNSIIEKDWDFVLKVVVKSFLNRILHYGDTDLKDKKKAAVTFKLFNPSIADFVINKYKNKPKKLSYLCLSLLSRPSLFTVKNLYEDSIISNETFSLIMKDINSHLLHSKNFTIDIKFTIRFIMNAFNSDIQLANLNELIIKTIEHIIDKSLMVEEIDEFFELLLYCIDQSLITYKETSYLNLLIEEMGYCSDNLYMIKATAYFELEKSVLEEHACDYLIETLKESLLEIDLNDIDIYSDCGEYSYSEREIIKKLEDYLDGIVESVNDELDIDISPYVDVYEITKSIDIEDMVYQFMRSYDEDYSNDHYRGKSTSHSNTEIDDLFQ